MQQIAAIYGLRTRIKAPIADTVQIQLADGATLDMNEFFYSGDYRIGIYAKQTIFQGDELFFEYMYDAHHRQQFVNNERVDDLQQDGLTILKRYGDNLILARPSYD